MYRIPVENVVVTEQSSDAALRLRAAVQALKAPAPFTRAPAPSSSVFGRAAAAVPDDAHPPVDAQVLGARLRSVETSALLPGTTLALLVVQHARQLRDLDDSCRQLIAGGATVVVLGPDLPRQVADRTRPLLVPLRFDDALSTEMAFLACGPERRIAFLARHETVGDKWAWLSTRDQVAVQRAGTAILERVPFLRLRVPTLSRTLEPFSR